MLVEPLRQSQPLLMAILNVTPDSFSDGGQYYQAASADTTRRRIDQLILDGADIIDIGGESTRPGAEPVSVAQELDRVMPAIEHAIAAKACVSIDTSTPEVIREAAALGAHMINDVRALTRPGALEAAATTGLPVCLMHMQGTPCTMQQNPQYDDIIKQVKAYLNARLKACINAGISSDRIWLDPGFGFGKTLAHNLSLLRHLDQLTDLKCRLLIGVSRKSMVGELLGRTVDQRLAGSLGFAMAALYAGAHILRVHDVGPTRDIIKVFNALNREG